VPGKPRSDTRERLLDAAFDLFLKKGYEGTAVTDVERSVGLKAGTGGFYRHFRSKQELLKVVVEREVTRCMQEVEREHADLRLPDDPSAQMEAAARQVLRDLQRFDDLLRLVIAERERVPELQEAFAGALVNSDAVGPWLGDATRLVAIAALAGYHFLNHLTGGPTRPVPEDDFIQALVSLLPPGRPPGVKPEQASPDLPGSASTKKRSLG
jgi:AcrR family transcriptional regulator